MNKQSLGSSRQFVLLKNENGQVSIFLGISLLIVVTFLAFIINVGLFVKAKINLQNAVDSAAYAGAAVQARQLTDIAYLNWELRNTYKEWMFKYYILGQKGMSATYRNKIFDTTLNPDKKMNFRLRPFYRNNEPGYDPNAYDPFNVPSICIIYGSNRNICEILRIPGLPRFTPQGLPGVDEVLEAQLNSIVATKSQDCSKRSSVNMGAAMLWAYGTGSDSLFQGIPLIAANRVGAWVEAVEIAIRMRNLESFVNTPPAPSPVCYGGNNCQDIASYTSNATVPIYERVTKAFWSAYRNLSGGTKKGQGSDFASSFKLTELSPNPVPVNPKSLNGFLIPGNSPALNKYYLDLEVNPMNYVTFYTSFISMTGQFRNTNVSQEADCGGTKTALPVPGYILGFTKNPKVMTYYAVKGQANYTGLFNPFNPSGIELTAYAAAKPFGGRIGPKLFKTGPNGQALFPREETGKQFSLNYASTLDEIGTLSAGSGKINAGYPLPIDPTFWARSTGAGVSIGGSPSAGIEVYFTLPNLIYDFEDTADLNLSSFAGKNINGLYPTNETTSYGSNPQQGNAGLYDAHQFQLFEANQSQGNGAVMSGQEVYASLNRSRRPTRYDAINYLIPIINSEGRQNPLETTAYVYQQKHDYQSNYAFDDSFYYKIYAPLYGPGTLFEGGPNSIVDVLNDYINSNKPAVDKYTTALKNMAEQMRVEAATNTTSSDAYITAADSIYNENPALVVSGQTNCPNLSMAQKFATFFNNQGGGCGITPLNQNLEKYFSNGRPDRPSELKALFKDYHFGIYTLPKSGISLNQLLTAYHPGARQGVLGETSGLPFGTQNLLVKRNFYSTKFFGLGRILDGSSNAIDQNQFIFMEGNSDRSFRPSNDLKTTIQNKLSPAEVSEFSDSLFF